MLTVEEFKDKYPGAFCWGSFNDYQGIYPGVINIKEGLLQFTEETAHLWAGPFEGNHAQFTLEDYTNAVFAVGPNKGKKVLEVWHQRDQDALDKKERGHYEYSKEHFHLYKWEQVHLENPVKLHISGNDDTSYSKFYPDQKSALEELELFIANEPLHAWDMIEGFDFIFTN